MDLSKKRWIILAASCLVNLCIGSLYAWSVFASPMAAHLSAISGREITGLATVFTVANSVGPITMISGGFINDRLGPKWAIFIGGLLFGGGMLLSGFATSEGMLVLTYGLGVGLGMGMVYGCTVSNAVKFFPDHRGLVGGLATASYGISSVLMPPVANALIDALGITQTFKVLGAAMLVVICLSAFFITRCPPGFVPRGWTPPAEAGGGAGKAADKNWRGMLTDPIFYIMLFILSCGAFAGLMTISQISPIAQRMVGLPVASATVVVSVLALLNTAGRIVAGFLSDKLGVANTLAGVFALSAVGLLVLSFTSTGQVVQLYAGVCCVGLGFGAIMGIFPGFTAAQFGLKNNSVNYGIMFIGFAIAGYFGPTIMSGIYQSSGSYKPAFLVAAGLAATGLVLTAVYRLLAKRQRAAG